MIIYKTTIEELANVKDSVDIYEKGDASARGYINAPKTILITEKDILDRLDELLVDILKHDCENVKAELTNRFYAQNVYFRLNISNHASITAGITIGDEPIEEDFDPLTVQLKSWDNTEYTVKRISVRYTQGYARVLSYIDRYVNRTLRKYPYCIREGKNIIPEEYRNDARAYVEKKKAGNSVSIERQMVNKSVRDKKELAREKMRGMLCNAENANAGNWTTVRISFDGRCADGRCAKAINSILPKNRQEILVMSDEEIVQKVKDYWKEQLMLMYKEIDSYEYRTEQ